MSIIGNDPSAVAPDAGDQTRPLAEATVRIASLHRRTMGPTQRYFVSVRPKCLINQRSDAPSATARSMSSPRSPRSGATGATVSASWSLSARSALDASSHPTLVLPGHRPLARRRSAMSAEDAASVFPASGWREPSYARSKIACATSKAKPL